MSVVYILLLSNGQYYVGSTDNIERRVLEHNNGKTTSTRHKRPVKLVFTQKFDILSEARKVEYRIKKQKSRIIIEKIILEGQINIKLMGD